jgi:hypothetical protein
MLENCTSDVATFRLSSPTLRHHLPHATSQSRTTSTIFSCWGVDTNFTEVPSSAYCLFIVLLLLNTFIFIRPFGTQVFSYSLTCITTTLRANPTFLRVLSPYILFGLSNQEWKWKGIWHVWGRGELHTGFWWGNLRVREHCVTPRRGWDNNWSSTSGMGGQGLG